MAWRPEFGILFRPPLCGLQVSDATLRSEAKRVICERKIT